MPNPVRIIIDLPDATGFSWKEAFSLWKENFPTHKQGFNTDPTYSWYKVNPDTNLPLEPLLTSGNAYRIGNPPGTFKLIDQSVEIAELREEIDAVERAVYRVKTDNIPVGEKVKGAMKKNVKKLYTRWAALDADSAKLAEIARGSA